MDCLLTLWPLLTPCSLGNGYCTFGFLIFIIVRNFLYHSLYILTEKSLKHLCPIRARVPVSFFLSLSFFFLFLSLSLWLILWSVETCRAHCPTRASKTLSRRLPVPSPPWEGARCLRERCKPCVKGFIGSLRKAGTISLFLSFTFLSLTPDHQVPVH